MAWHHLLPHLPSPFKTLTCLNLTQLPGNIPQPLVMHVQRFMEELNRLADGTGAVVGQLLISQGTLLS